MEFGERESLLVKILSRNQIIKLDGRIFHIRPITIEQRLEAQILFNELSYDLSFEGWLSLTDTEHILISMGLWSKDLTTRKEQFEKQTDEIKMQMYRVHTDSVKVEKLRKMLRSMQTSLIRLQSQRSILDHSTIEYYITTLTNEYLFALSIYDSNGCNIYNSNTFWTDDGYILLGCLHQVLANKVGLSQIREISRTDPWRNYWNIGKERVFGFPISEFTEEQKALAIFSKMYDNAYSHPECPTDYIIEDDDLFDGWLLIQEDTRKKDMAKRNVEKIIGKAGSNHGEVFIPVQSENDIERINSLNDFNTRMVRKQREQALKDQGKISDGKFTDQQIELREQARQMFVQKVRGK